MNRPKIKVGIIGFGTVGAGTAECLLKNREILSGRAGIDIELAHIADLDITTDRGLNLPPGILTTDVNVVLDNCDVIVELIGGKTVAKDIILRAIELGKPVVTANKALLAEKGIEIFTAAKAKGTNIYYEASVGGGIPIIKAIRESFAGNRINAIYGILNGTCNYILTKMENENMPFEPALTEAQKQGFAEADPAFDIDGIDTAHKISILSSLAYGKWFGMEPVYVEGLRKLDVRDLKFAKQLGYRIKLLGITRMVSDDVEIRVHPTLVPSSKVIARVDGVFNAVDVNGDYVGDAFFSGRGAGRQATASAVVSDIFDAALDLVSDSHRRVPPFRTAHQFEKLVPIGEVITRHYMRLECHDMVGAYAKITKILSDHSVSISGIMQRESSESDVTVLLMTHLARESDVRNAITALEALPETIGAAVHIRVEDW